MVTTNLEAAWNIEAHRKAIMAPINELAGLLEQLLSRRITAYTVGVKDAKTIARWAQGAAGPDSEIRDPEVEKRLRTTYEIAQLLLQFDGPRTVKAWFIGPNPLLEDVSPSEVIREGRLKDALAAARSFIVHG